MTRTQGLFLSLLLLSAVPASAAPRIKIIKLSVTNTTSLARPAEDVVVSVAALKRVAPDFRANPIVVTTSDASTLDQDAETLATTELPSQADDLDGDDKADEIAFQIALAPQQTRIVNIAYGETATLARLRADYPKRVDARFARKFEGLGWEGEQNA